MDTRKGIHAIHQVTLNPRRNPNANNATAMGILYVTKKYLKFML